MLDNSEGGKMDNPDKFARYDTQDEEKNKTKDTIQYVLETTILK